jgi:hypothetical protein
LSRNWSILRDESHFLSMNDGDIHTGLITIHGYCFFSSSYFCKFESFELLKLLWSNDD